MADREGPSFEATRADLSKNFLYSYFAATEHKQHPLACGNAASTHPEYGALFRCHDLYHPYLVEEDCEFRSG